MRARTAAWTAGIAALAMTLAACGSDDGADPGSTGNGDTPAASTGLSGTLNGAGSSAQTAAMQAWQSGFQASNEDATVNYDPVGSGGGREQFIAGSVDFAGSDAALDDEEIADAEQQCGGAGTVVEVPVYISPIAIVYHFTDMGGLESLQFSAETLAGIFNQEITTWDDPAIAADNPDAPLPSTAITPVNRSDKSGTTENFTDYLAKAAGSAWGHDASGDWPVSGGEAANGTSGMVQAVGGGDGTIGYADASQAGDLGVASVKVGDGYVGPSAEAAAAIVDASTQADSRADNDLAYELERTPTDASAYPIVLLSYQIACTTYADANKTALVKAFLSHVVSAEGQTAAAAAAGSAPISETLRTAAIAAIATIGAT